LWLECRNATWRVPAVCRCALRLTGLGSDPCTAPGPAVDSGVPLYYVVILGVWSGNFRTHALVSKNKFAT
jgi:hypothetical protein